MRAFVSFLVSADNFSEAFHLRRLVLCDNSAHSLVGDAAKSLQEAEQDDHRVLLESSRRMLRT